jgi:hypothetical protein
MKYGPDGISDAGHCLTTRASRGDRAAAIGQGPYDATEERRGRNPMTRTNDDAVWLIDEAGR